MVHLASNIGNFALLLTHVPHENNRVLGFDTQAVFSTAFNIMNIAVLAFILWRLLYGPVKEYLAKRTARIEAQIADAATRLDEAEGFKNEYTTKLGQIDTERVSILDSVKKRALTDEAAIIKKANEMAEQLKIRANDDISREKDKANYEMKRQILELSTMLAARYISEKIDADHQNKLLDDIIEEMRGAKWQS